jgi:hypothetical protein
MSAYKFSSSLLNFIESYWCLRLASRYLGRFIKTFFNSDKNSLNLVTLSYSGPKSVTIGVLSSYS